MLPRTNFSECSHQCLELRIWTKLCVPKRGHCRPPQVKRPNASNYVSNERRVRQTLVGSLSCAQQSYVLLFFQFARHKRESFGETAALDMQVSNYPCPNAGVLARAFARLFRQNVLAVSMLQTSGHRSSTSVCRIGCAVTLKTCHGVDFQSPRRGWSSALAA